MTIVIIKGKGFQIEGAWEEFGKHWGLQGGHTGGAGKKKGKVESGVLLF